MKKIWLFVLVLAIISCKKEPTINYAVISGKILNKNVNELTFRNQENTINKKITLADDGSFVDTLTVDAGTYFFKDGKNFTAVYIEPGYNLNVDYDAYDFDNTLEFNGVGAIENSYLSEKNKQRDELLEKGSDIYLLEEEAYKAKLNEVKTTLETLLESKEEISNDFKLKEQNNLKYEYLNMLNRYENYHSHYAKKENFKVSEDFLDELNELTYDNEEDFMFSPDYQSLVDFHYSKLSEELIEKDSISEDIAYLKTVSSIPSDKIRNKLMFDYAKYGITYTYDLEDFYSIFMKSTTNSVYKNKITESYNKLKKVSKGQPSPKFVNYENYAGETTSLDDLKGKYVYIDVWATWCGPCKREIPSLKELEKQYHNKNIEFVSISIDRKKDHDKWKNMVKEKELKGVQLFADKDWESDFVKEYLIMGIPRFILVDPNGNIVNHNAPRPSEEKLINLFNELNI